ncbi:glycoside hydrolase family 20 protein [Snuella lapsa]|uniref:beta-N-acetylhexosaminidase n=1 Tax=Snuella lapsa TaxID=870481 RepID=A0ABP6Y9N5_9FLAO
MNCIKICFAGVLFLIISCKNNVQLQSGVIPQPYSVQYEKGYFHINEETVIVVDDTVKGKKIVEELTAFLQSNFNLRLSVGSEANVNTIQLILQESGNTNGGYQLEVSSRGIVISSGAYRGLFYGIQTLKQLLSPKIVLKEPILQLVKINDSPEFSWRGMMLDVSRHFFPKDSVKKVIDIMAMHKMNKFHWHLVDGIGWRIQIDAYPELTNKGAWRKVKPNKKPWEDFESCYRDDEASVYGGYYTKEDIREIVAYASDRYIDVIPEIEMPGHSEAALQCYPELTCVGAEGAGVYCAGNDKTFAFLQNILTEVIELFPYQYVHIGGDEVGKGTWLQCTRCIQRMEEENLSNGEALQSYFVKRMEAYIHSKQRKLIGWDEILEGGLPPRATVMSWRGVTGGIEAANDGHDVVMSPGSPCYFDHSQGKSEFEPPSWGGYNNLLKVYDFNPVPEAISKDKKHHILGGQANLWTEQIKDMKHLQYMMLPRVCALSEALWCSSDKKDKEQFIKKMDIHFDRLKELGYNYAESALTPDYNVGFDKDTGDFRLTLTNELNLYEIRYTLDGSQPNADSQLYDAPILYRSPVNLYALCFRQGKPVGYPLKRMFSTGFGDKCQIKYLNPYNETYSGGGDKALFDNKFAIARGDDPSWQGISGKDFDIIIELGNLTYMSYISMNFFQHIGATSVMLPTQVLVSVSSDGKNYTTVLDESISTDKSRDPIIKRIETEFKKQPVAFIKIVAKNRGELPDWHIRKGDAWLFLDEVSIK